MMISRSVVANTSDALNLDAATNTVAYRLLAERAWAGQQALADAIERLSMTLQLLHPPATLTQLPLAAEPSFGSTSAPPVAVRCLGAFQVVVGGVPVEIWRSARARALFQYLVSHREHPIRRDALFEALWPDPETTPASTSLKVVIHRLRKALASLSTTQPIDVHVSDDGYQLNADGLWVDVEQFDQSCLQARQFEAAGNSGAAVAQYTAAADLYRGDFLLDIDDEWAILRRERLKDQYLHVLSRVADAALAAGDYQGCIERCQQTLEHDPCREDAYRALIVSHARLGQRGRARRWYEVCVQALRTDLDVEPEPETQLTYRRAIAGEFSNHSGPLNRATLM